MINDKTLYILWANADINTSLHMVLMYAENSLSHAWWDKVTVIIWGAPTKLIAENTSVQEEMKIAMENGVKFSACISCAKKLGVVEKLQELGIEVIPWGEPLTKILMENGKLLTV